VYFYQTINTAGWFKISDLLTVWVPLVRVNAVAFSAGVYQSTASSSEGLLGLGSQVKLRPSMPWLSDWKSGVCRLKGSRSGLSAIGHLL
jgi:hypothetical protein